MIEPLDPLDLEPVPVAGNEDLMVPTSPQQRAALRFAAGADIVLAAAEVLVGLLIGSVALVAIAIDSLRDAAACGSALLLGGRSRRLYRVAAGLIAIIAAVMFLWVFIAPFAGLGTGRVPNPWAMIAVALASLAVNLIVAWRLRVLAAGESDLRWIWRQTRWDMAADVGVIIAALAVSDFAKRWPDVAAGYLIALFSLWGIYRVLRAMWRVA